MELFSDSIVENETIFSPKRKYKQVNLNCRESNLVYAVINHFTTNTIFSLEDNLFSFKMTYRLQVAEALYNRVVGKSVSP